jgi:RND family efflux transporter MFP subunit
LDSLPDHPFPAKIVWVGDSINATTRTLPVRANVANPDLILKPGMFARIKVSAGEIPVTMIPRSAVQQIGDRTLVFVAKGNNLFEERDVETGINDADDVEIMKGVKLGERVVTRGTTALLGTVMKSSEGGD